MFENGKTEEKIIAYRRLFHRFPEPGWLTYFATLFLAEHLQKAGYEVHVGREILGEECLMDPPDAKERTLWQQRARIHAIEAGISDAEYWFSRMDGETGVVALLETGRPGLVRAYRFDMDALTVAESGSSKRTPVRENFVSEHPGVSHACAHDGHMALGLALAEYLAQEKAALSGRIIFIFQPAEEGVRGASAFCHRWQYGKIDRLFCCHIGFAPENTFVAGAKGFLATTKFDADFYGKSAHAGLAPERGKNALLAAASAVMKMQEIKPPGDGITRLNTGQLRAGEARNTIPAHAWMQVETRGGTGALNTYMKIHALRCIEQASERYGVRCEVVVKGESVSAGSDAALSRSVLALAEKCGGFSDCLLTKDFGASDDGAVFMDMVQRQGGQAVYMLFGAKVTGLHHETVFDFAEDVLVRAFLILRETAVMDC